MHRIGLILLRSETKPQLSPSENKGEWHEVQSCPSTTQQLKVDQYKPISIYYITINSIMTILNPQNTSGTLENRHKV